VQILDTSCFLVLLAIGIALRKNPAAHKRMMILSSVALASPGFSRITGYFSPTNPNTPFLFLLNAYYGNILLVALMLCWDLYRGRLIRSHVIASMSLVVCMFFNSVLFFWKPWSDLTLRWVTAWAK
jgi:hypothetical protein